MLCYFIYIIWVDVYKSDIVVFTLPEQTSYPALQGGTFWGILGPILAYYVYFLRAVHNILWNFVQKFLVFLLRVTAQLFPYHDPTGEL